MVHLGRVAGVVVAVVLALVLLWWAGCQADQLSDRGLRRSAAVAGELPLSR